MGSTDNSAIMTIDLKWNRFRIHKSTLNKMGNPQYVQLAQIGPSLVAPPTE